MDPSRQKINWEKNSLRLEKENGELRLLNQYLTEQVHLLQVQLYGKKSEKMSTSPHPDQLSYMESIEPVKDPSWPTGAEESKQTRSRKRKKGGRKPLPEDLPMREVIHDIPESEKWCGCGDKLHCFGRERAKQLVFIPAKLEVVCHTRLKYACKKCEGVESDGKAVRIASAPKQILPKSIASPELLAQIVVAKFVDALPLYRQEQQFLRLGYFLSRTNMANWIIKLGKTIEPLLRLLKEEILSSPLINMDETTIQVLKEEGRDPSSKSYIWALCSGSPGKRGIYFEYDPSRAAKVAKDLLRNYPGVVQTDGYSGYDFLDKKRHAGCWSHARRYFMNVIKAYGKNR